MSMLVTSAASQTHDSRNQSNINDLRKHIEWDVTTFGMGCCVTLKDHSKFEYSTCTSIAKSLKERRILKQAASKIRCYLLSNKMKTFSLCEVAVVHFPHYSKLLKVGLG